jgi:[ribosomal protein S5]-alanine N-acetyltransferase
LNRAPTLEGKGVMLRRPRESDIEDRLQCGRHPEIIRMYGGDTRSLKPLTREDAVAAHRRALSHPLEWAIEHEGKWIGVARLTVSEVDRRARFAIGIADITKLGKGMGTEATRLVLGHAFAVMRLHRVDLRVLEYNKRAIRCYEKCGFVREGVEREGALVEGNWETDVMMSILEHEYRAQQERDTKE